MNKYNLIEKIASSPDFIKRAIEERFVVGFRSELMKMAEDDISVFNVPKEQRRSSYKQFLKNKRDEEIAQVGIGPNVLTKEDAVRNAVNLIRRADTEMMESGSTPVRAIAAAAFPILEGFALRKAIGTSMHEVRNMAEESSEY